MAVAVACVGIEVAEPRGTWQLLSFPNNCMGFTQLVVL